MQLNGRTRASLDAGACCVGGHAVGGHRYDHEFDDDFELMSEAEETMLERARQLLRGSGLEVDEAAPG